MGIMKGGKTYTQASRPRDGYGGKRKTKEIFKIKRTLCPIPSTLLLRCSNP